MLKFWGILSLAIFMAIGNLAAKEVLLLSDDELNAAVKEEFVDQGYAENTELEFYGGQTSFAIDDAKKAKIMVSKLKLDEEQGKFSAEVEIFADGKAYAKTTVQGKYYTMAEAWVPAQNINKGEIITEDKLRTIAIKSSRIKQINVIEKDKLLNFEAKKSLKEGKVINKRDIGNILMIKKGELVNSIYKSKGLQIIAKVEALEDGHRGQNIEVMNTKSAKKFFATVVDKDTVEVSAQ